MVFSIRGLLVNHTSLGIRELQEEIDYEIFRHYEHDSGCRREAVSYLRPYFGMFHHAIVIFDKHGSGRESQHREEIEGEIEHLLSINGWGDRARVVVIDPELEQWIWGDYTRVGETLKWPGGGRGLRQWLLEQNYLNTEKQDKAAPPKEAFQHALEHINKSRSSGLYRDLAEKVRTSACTDPAFQKLKSTLQDWFPTE